MALRFPLHTENTGRVLPAVKIDITANVAVLVVAAMEKNAVSGSDVLPQYRLGWALKICNPLINRTVSAMASIQ